MNILIISHYSLYQDLSLSFVHHQAAAYASLGHRVRALIPTPVGKRGPSGSRLLPALERKLIDGVEVFYVRFLSLSKFGERWFNTPSAQAAIRLYEDTRSSAFQPDVIHAHTLGFDSELGARLKNKLHCPLIVTTHGSDSSIPMERGELARMKAFCDKADQIVAVSTALADRLRSCGTATPISAILNGFAIQHIAPNGKKTEATLLQAGALKEQKRPEVTLRALAKLRQARADARLAFVGDGPERERLEALGKELNIADAVRFTGQISNQDVLAEMAKAQFFVLPSVREGFGIVYLEAMASGCITIGTEGEGIADLIRSGENGFLVPPDDPDAIVDVIEQCLADPEKAATIAARGHQDAMELTWERNAAHYIALFQTLREKMTT